MFPFQTGQPVSNCTWQPLESHRHTHAQTFSTHIHTVLEFFCFLFWQASSALTDGFVLLRGCSVSYVSTTRSDVHYWHLGILQTEGCLADWQLWQLAETVGGSHATLIWCSWKRAVTQIIAWNQVSNYTLTGINKGWCFSGIQ